MMEPNMDPGAAYDLCDEEVLKTLSVYSIMPRAFINSNTSSDNEGDLPDNEQAVDLIQYLDSECDMVQTLTGRVNDLLQSPLRAHNTGLDFLHSPVRPQRSGIDDCLLSPESAYSTGLDFLLQSPAQAYLSRLDNIFLRSPVRTLSSRLDDDDDSDVWLRSATAPWDFNNSPAKRSFASDFVISPEKSDWALTLVKEEPTMPEFQAWFPDREVKEEEPDDFMTVQDWTDIYGPGTSQEVQLKVEAASDDEVAGDDSRDSEIDVETVIDMNYKDALFRQIEVGTPRPTQSRGKVVSVAHVISMKKPVGRPRGTKKQTTAAAAATKQASTSQDTLQPSSSNSVTETSSVSRCASLAQKRKLAKCDTATSPDAPCAYAQVPLYSSYSVNFHDYAMSPLSPASTSSVESFRPIAQARRVYRRNTSLDVVDKEKQNHHNQLERNRRQKLADNFTKLRLQVPKIADNPKASKVLILNEAREEIISLKDRHELQTAEELRESEKNKMLKNQLHQLKAKLCGRLK